MTTGQSDNPVGIYFYLSLYTNFIMIILLAKS